MSTRSKQLIDTLAAEAEKILQHQRPLKKTAAPATKPATAANTRQHQPAAQHRARGRAVRTVPV